MKMKMSVLYLGNLIPEKGVLVLLEACRLLVADGNEFFCHIVGAGTRELSVEQCRTIVKDKGLADYVTVHGPLYGEEKEEMWKLCDVFVFPTFYHNECFPLVILEAMLHSLPVIATPVGAIPDMVIDGKTGMLVPEQDVEALAEAMQKMMINASGSSLMGANVYELFLKKYTLSQFEDNLTAILQES